MPITPSTYANCVWFIDPSTGVTASANRVSAVTDQSVAGNHLSQATSTLQPYAVTTSPASLQFDLGTDTNTVRYLTSSLSLNQQNFTIAVVADKQCTRGYATLVGAAGGNYVLVQDIGGINFGVVIGGQWFPSIAIRTSRNVIVLTSSASGRRLTINGVTVTTTASSAWLS